MGKHTEVFVGLDVAKSSHPVAVAKEGRQGEVRYLGEIGADPSNRNSPSLSSGFGSCGPKSVVHSWNTMK